MKNLLLWSRIANLYLKVRFMLFRKYVKKTDFSNRKLVFSDDFKTLDNFEIENADFYNDNSVWFEKESIKLTNEGVSIVCYKDKKEHTSWRGTRVTDWTSGVMTTSKTFTLSKGVWVVEAKICDSWPAIWLLKNGRPVVGYDREQITPEIDVMEVMKHRWVRHTLHYGYSNTVYRKYGIGSNIFKCDNEFHEFAVELLDNGYKFYIDGVCTARYKSNNPEFVTDSPNFILLNNAAHKYTTKDTDFVIKSVKAYE